ncbi:dienelactone hydrolase family protein [Roseivivax halodurans]|uniref:dienelactone hydrolase family protein n=1 Tax=Roseivivax halodurans TaxID=93683 RepID=UPI0004AEA398|nr:dienelactone hydrolase family protein [Roseivivax halodurans]
MSRRRPAIVVTLLVVTLLVGAAALNVFRRQAGLVPEDTPAARWEMLAPAARLSLPSGGPPYKTALLLSGCDGVRDNMDRWAKALNAAGWATMILDSHTPRKLDDDPMWRLVCSGQRMIGAERAGDIAVALAEIDGDPRLDGEHLALVGASHGGWAILDYLRLAELDRVPPGLTRWPEGRDPLGGITGAVTLYPYCGLLSEVAAEGLATSVPTLMLLARDDAIVDETECEALAEDVPEAVEVHVYDGATHGFDQKERSWLSDLEFNATITEDALARGIAHLSAD